MAWNEWELGEAGCLRRLFSLLGQTGAGQTSFVGYNVLSFDVPFVNVRLWELRLYGRRCRLIQP